MAKDKELVFLTTGNDKYVAGNGESGLVIRGLRGNDEIIAGNGKNDIRGNKGDDVLVDGNGKGIVRGGMGDDTMTGGRGNDVFDFKFPDQGSDTITDFDRGNDVLDFSKFGLDASDLDFSGNGVSFTYQGDVFEVATTGVNITLDDVIL